MHTRRKALLYGNSVILGSLEVSLQRSPQFEVIYLRSPLPGTAEFLALTPEVIIFDLEATQSEALFSLLDDCPKVLLVGLNPDTNLVKIWAGRQLQELSTQGLLKIIDEQIKGIPVL